MKRAIDIMKKCLFIIVLGLLQVVCYSQTDTKAKHNIGEQIFLPALEIGYVHNISDILSGGLILKTSIEYRLRNNNDVFFRLNYDTYDAEYRLQNLNGLTNIVNGTVLFSDLLLGGGYRFGETKYRYFLMLQPGIKFYNYPQATQSASDINIRQESRNVLTSRFTFGFEYYLNEKSAFSIDLFQNQVWVKKDFWNEQGSGIGLSIGFTTALL